jgi:transposase
VSAAAIDRTIALTDEVTALRQQIADYEQLVQVQDAKLAWLTKLVYGPKAERRPPVQDHGAARQVNFLEAPVTAQAAAEPLEETSAPATAAKDLRNAKKGRGPDGKRKAVNGGGRRPVNRSMREVELVIHALPDERVAADGTPLVLLGYEISTREHYIAAELVRQVLKRERWGLPDTHETVTVAPVPPTIVPKGKYSDEVICEALCRKYVLGLPFTRMLADFRAMGSDLSDAQLSDLAGRFATFLSPIAQAIRLQVLARSFVHVDETPLPTLDGRRTLWAWVGGTQAFFHVGGRGGKELRQVLGLPTTPADTDTADDDPGPDATIGWTFTHLMADAYRPYDIITAAVGIGRLYCWAHARRGFLTPAADHDPIAADLLDRIKALYQVERDAHHVITRTGLQDAAADAERHLRRQADALPILAGIHAACRDALPRYDARSVMHGALAYLLDRWDGFSRYTTRGDLPIDNNQAERAIRPIVIGRKNWLFIGSEDATAWAATNFTLFESCRLTKVDPRAWLRHVIARLHAGDTDYATMTPAACAKRFPAQV